MQKRYETLISSPELDVLLSQPEVIVVDCRFDLARPAAGRQQYLSGHVPGAVFADLETDLSAPAGPRTGRHPLPDVDDMRQAFSRLGITAGIQVIAYDDVYGAFAARLWWMLRYMGHEAVAVLDGGWSDWLARGFRVEEGNNPPRPATFNGSPREDRLIRTADIPAVACLVDSRDPVRYRGESEPVDPVAGHIPGAVNYFWKQNLDDDGRFLARDELKRQLLALFTNTEPADAGFYCGSGVTACHNLLAAVYAGLPLPRLYAGSWSQWCSDPARPVATGD